MSYRSTLFISSLLAAVPAVHAQEAATAEATLGEVTVSTTGMAASDMATPVQVLGEEELRLRRAATLGETLAAEPGINASHFGAGASRPVIRGMDGARVSVLSDGSELLDASTVSPDHAVTTEPLLATQMEVLRGPSALLYSAGAMGGVVNVLDGKIATTVPDKALQGSAEVQAGSAAGMAAGAFSLTGVTPLGANNGSLVMHAEGAARNAGDYRVGSGWGAAARCREASAVATPAAWACHGSVTTAIWAWPIPASRPSTACLATSTVLQAAMPMATICIAAITTGMTMSTRTVARAAFPWWT